MSEGPVSCHPDCGPIVAILDKEHAHRNVDGTCWHDNDDGLPPDAAVAAEAKEA